MKNASINKILGKYTNKGKSKFNKNRSYSDFWMDSAWDNRSMYGGLSGRSSGGSADIVKSIKLASYHRAVANFTKILTKKDISVVFQGNESFTDGKTISLSANVGEKNFDVHVGLALHEASHCILTDFKVMPELYKKHDPYKKISWDTLRSLLNWVEDRRIDNYVFTSSPGYKAYYHKLYDHYWNADVITKALKSPKYREVTEDSYMLHITNMLNPAFNPAALPGLDAIVKLIDVRNIARLTTTQDAADVALEVAHIISVEIAKDAAQKAAAQNNQPQPSGGQASKPAGEKEKDDEKNEENEAQQPQSSTAGDTGSAGDEEEENEEEENEGGTSAQGAGAGDSEEDGEDGEEDSEEDGEDGAGNEGEEEEELTDLTPEEAFELAKALEKQEEFLDGNIKDRTTGTKNLQNKLDKISQSGVEMQMVHNGKYECLVYDFAKKGAYFTQALGCYMEKRNARCKIGIYESMDSTERQARINHLNKEFKAYEGIESILDRYFCADNSKSVEQGLQHGALLGRKLQLRNESRELTHNRLTSGKLDAKRIAHAGYGIESVFKQMHVDSYKSTYIHISLDASGSMGGTKWKNTIIMAMAIAKAATYCQNLDVQVSLRHTTADGKTLPVIVQIYDSKRNPLSQLVAALKSAHVPSMTPEGLCFEAMLKKNMLIKSGKDTDSYFLNISDGGPGGVGNYHGEIAHTHTRKQVKTMEEQLGMKIISFFVQEGGGNDVSSFFKEMYGTNNSFACKADDMIGIARALNSKFLDAKVTA